MKQQLIVTYWYERGGNVIVATEPGHHGTYLGTLELTPDELRQAHTVAWETRLRRARAADPPTP
jgi:hypothetical protein